MSEVSKLAVEIAKSRYAKKKKENELAKEQAENCAKLIFEVFKVTDNILQVTVESRGKNLACGVKFYDSDLKFAFLEDLDFRKGKKPLHEAMDAIYRLKAIPVKYISDFLSHDKDIIKYYSIGYNDKKDAVIVKLKDMNEIETVCENEESTE